MKLNNKKQNFILLTKRGRNALSVRRSVLLCLSVTAIIFIMTGCRTHRKGQKLHGTPVSEYVVPANVSAGQQELVDEAMTWLGTPYKYSWQIKGKGTDCSGMVVEVYGHIGVDGLPRNSAKQAEYCRNLKAKDVEVGDLVFFATGKDPHKISHVGIMLDKDNFIHASTSKGVVISQISTPYYTRTFKQYGRVPGFEKVLEGSKISSEKNINKHNNKKNSVKKESSKKSGGKKSGRRRKIKS
ncbi:MAG: C40 family peptidase [Muribaculaceae bacterium]|nr:C40 family peptidase [Muribaculaceae bacterium]